MGYPLISLSLVFSLGILTAAFLNIPFFIFCLATFLFLILGIIFIKENKKFYIFILSAFFFLGAALLNNYQILPNNHISRLIRYKNDSLCMIGLIDSDLVYQSRNVSFILKAERLGIDDLWRKTCGKVLVKISPAEDKSALGVMENGFFYGDRLLLSGSLSRPFSFSKRFDYKNYLKHRNIYSILSVKKGRGMVRRISGNIGNPVKSAAIRIKHKMKNIIVKNSSVFSSSLLNAVILGERQNLPAYLKDILVYSGTVHIIAISGLHLGIVAFIILLILKIIRIPRKPRYILTILILVVYCLLTGANTPVMRATVMAAILLFSYFPRREVNIFNSLSLAALIILLFNPWQLFEISFQLSFLSVISIVWFFPKIKSVFPEKLDKIPWLHFLISAFSLSFAAWIGLLPLIAYHFKIISPVTILANMIIVPYMAIIVASGFSLVFIGAFIPSLAPVFAASNELFVLILFRIISFLTVIPGAYFKLPEISFVYVLFYYVSLITVIYFSKAILLDRLTKK